MRIGLGLTCLDRTSTNATNDMGREHSQLELVLVPNHHGIDGWQIGMSMRMVIIIVMMMMMMMIVVLMT